MSDAKLETWRFVKGQVSAGAATAVDWLIVTGCIHFDLAHYTVAVALGALAGAVTDFAIKRGWVFDHGGASIHGQIWKYVLVSAASLAWNELLSVLAIELLHLPKIPGVLAAAIVVGAAWNYPMHRLFVFRRARESSTET